MAIEAGAKNGIFIVDDITKEYIKNKVSKQTKAYFPDEDAEYDEVYDIDLSNIKSTVAFPHLPENTHNIDEIEAMEDINIDQVVIGSCTNGRLSDMKEAAEILKGKKLHRDVRGIVIPATQKIYKQCMHLGYTDIFIDAGCVVSTPTCGPCLGGHMGVLAGGESCVSTTNRNFVGRMGHVDSKVYLASPAVAAASAITGKISGPNRR
jgi:3-isopropylmalate/(R)-2-methylmalate dehydratase large subunit